MPGSSPSEPPAEYLRRKLQESADAQPMNGYCIHCPDWVVAGTAEQVRVESEAHRQEEHPELFKKKKIARKRRSFSQAMTTEREEQIEEERRQRMRALGLG